MMPLLPSKSLCVAICVALVTAASASQPERPPRPDVESQPFAGASACTFDRVLLGPSGTEVAVWSAATKSIIGSLRFVPPTQVVVGRLHEPQESSRNRFFSYQGRLRLVPIRWSASGDRLYVRVRESQERVVAFTADGAPLAEVAPLDGSWDRVDINAITHGDVGALDAEATLRLTRRIDHRNFIRGSATFGRTLTFLAVNRSDLGLVRIGETGDSPLGINASQADVLTAFPDERDYRRGVAYRGAPLRRTAPYFPYQLPIVDQGSGRVVGTIGATGVALGRAGGLAQPLERFRRMQAEAGFVALDASYSTGALAVLAMTGRGDRRLFRIGTGGVSEQPLCAVPLENRRGRTSLLPFESADEGPRPHLRLFSIGRDGRESMAGGRPIVMVHRIGGGSENKRDALVYFSGGPGGASLDSFRLVAGQRVLGPDRDVVYVDYSGSQGGGVALTRRLARRGIGAIEDDIDSLALWLRREGYRNVYIVGASFGAVPAMVAVSRHRQLVAGAYFLAPLLRYRAPEEWVAVGTSGNGPVLVDTQMARDNAYYGGEAGRRRFAAELQALVATAPLGVHDRFYFGSLDAISKVEDLPQGTPSPVRIIVGGHGPAVGSDEIWTELRALMGASRPPR